MEGITEGMEEEAVMMIAEVVAEEMAVVEDMEVVEEIAVVEEEMAEVTKNHLVEEVVVVVEMSVVAAAVQGVSEHFYC